MDPDAALKRERDMEAIRREMYRKSRDTIRIYNPLDFDFIFYHDGYPNVVKARSTKDVERYKARLFFKKIADFMIGQLQLAKGNQLIEERRKRGVPEFLDKYVENREVWDKVPALDDPTLLKSIGEQVILGLVEEYGLEVPDKMVSADFQRADLRPIQEQMVDLFSNKLAEDHPAPQPPVAPIKQKLEMEVTDEH